MLLSWWQGSPLQHKDICTYLWVLRFNYYLNRKKIYMEKEANFPYYWRVTRRFPISIQSTLVFLICHIKNEISPSLRTRRDCSTAYTISCSEWNTPVALQKPLIAKSGSSQIRKTQWDNFGNFARESQIQTSFQEWKNTLSGNQPIKVRKFLKNKIPLGRWQILN